jgi:RNA polymerase sigma factor (TIGR02999 family)
MAEVTQILKAIERGQPHAAGELLPLVYDELRRLAAYRLAHEPPGQTLQATALVHEAYLRLLNAGCDQWEDPRHFFNAVAEAMRRILIDNARRKKSVKHGGDLKRANLEAIELPVATPPDELLALDEALDRLAQVHPDAAQLVKLLYFVGMTQEEAARTLGVSRRTVNYWWDFARAWLYQAMHPDEPGPPPPENNLHK